MQRFEHGGKLGEKQEFCSLMLGAREGSGGKAGLGSDSEGS